MMKPTSQQPVHVEPLALTIPNAVAASGFSRTELYRQLAAGNIRAVKAGKRTLVLADSLKKHLASLPPATFNASQRTDQAA